MANVQLRVLVALVALTQLAEARPKATAGEISHFCRTPDTFSQDMCRLYVINMLDSIKLSQNISHSKKTVCVPDGVSDDTIIARFVAVANSDFLTHPSDADEPAAAMVLLMAEASFPCPPP